MSRLRPLNLDTYLSRSWAINCWSNKAHNIFRNVSVLQIAFLRWPKQEAVGSAESLIIFIHKIFCLTKEDERTNSKASQQKRTQFLTKKRDQKRLLYYKKSNSSLFCGVIYIFGSYLNNDAQIWLSNFNQLHSRK